MTKIILDPGSFQFLIGRLKIITDEKIELYIFEVSIPHR